MRAHNYMSAKIFNKTKIVPKIYYTVLLAVVNYNNNMISHRNCITKASPLSVVIYTQSSNIFCYKLDYSTNRKFKCHMTSELIYRLFYLLE